MIDDWPVTAHREDGTEIAMQMISVDYTEACEGVIFFITSPRLKDGEFIARDGEILVVV